MRLDSVGRTFGTPNGQVDVLRGVELELPAGEIVAVIGASGCGKSTLLRLVAGLDQPTDGAITVDGDRLADTDERAAIASGTWTTASTRHGLRLAAAHGRIELVELIGSTEGAPRHTALRSWANRLSDDDVNAKMERFATPGLSDSDRIAVLFGLRDEALAFIEET